MFKIWNYRPRESINTYLTWILYCEKKSGRVARAFATPLTSWLKSVVTPLCISFWTSRFANNLESLNFLALLKGWMCIETGRCPVFSGSILREKVPVYYSGFCFFNTIKKLTKFYSFVWKPCRLHFYTHLLECVTFILYGLMGRTKEFRSHRSSVQTLL